MMKTTQRFYRKYFGLCCEWYLEQRKLNWAADFQFALFPYLVNGIKTTAFYEAGRNLYLDLLHLVAASFRSLALPLTAKLAPSAASPLRAEPASLGSGPVQATGTALHPDLLHRNVKKICLRQIFSVGRNGFAARRELRRRQGYTSICSIK